MNKAGKTAITKTINLIKKSSSNKIELKYWFSDGEDHSIHSKCFNPHKCKTTACVAGWIHAANFPKSTFNAEKISKILELNYDLEIRLFYSTDALDGLLPEEKKERLIKVLETLRDTDKVDWSPE